MPSYKPSATENILRLIGIHTVHKTTDPTSSDKNYGVPTLWVNDISQTAFLLIYDDGSTVTWIDVGDAAFPRNFDDFYDATTAPPVSPTTGDSYILSTDTPVDSGWTALGATNNDYVEYNGSTWTTVNSMNTARLGLGGGGTNNTAACFQSDMRALNHISQVV